MENDREIKQVLKSLNYWELVEEIKIGGKPATAGSKRAFHSKKTGKTWVTDDCTRGKEWRATVRAACVEQRVATELYQGPLLLFTRFYLARPKSHYRTGKFASFLKDSAPVFPAGKPDTTKLLRAIEDALTGVLWKDDSQVVFQITSKSYGRLPGAVIKLYTVQ